ncbi:acyltransferase [Leptolyngbya cf. ectocarpi LEGE 11479]|uniref:Acyltransferase n=1 Tax=Leptolyngbya cf. ectocarpi LEGE 11479 TaxID=1828722 RepID=A0A928ZUG6_LEPEC|nr:acyltransferase [Leptolyngbya ectocarpi]MBE9067682.1 acyltransferase [Leptolyngbya cf. ectocarpi LEGE 11479]
MTRRFTRSAAVQRLAWLDGLRIFAAVMILLYHAQLLFTQYRYTPQPTGLIHNLQQLLPEANSLMTLSGWIHLLGIPTLFGFQFVDVFVLLSGFSLMLATRQRSFDWLTFWQKRLSRLLWPLWTVSLLSYPILWVIGAATQSYSPTLWNLFAASTFPLLFDYRGSLLMPISGPWWFIPLILSFTLCFPLLHRLMYRWGGRHLVAVSLVITLGYRALATYVFGGQPTYTMLDTVHGPLPFYVLLAKLSTFVIGMVAAQAYKHGRGVLFWPQRKALQVGVSLYAAGFICQFYQLGWLVCDLLVPLGLTLVCMVVFRRLTAAGWNRRLALGLGTYSYSFFLIHNFVVDRTLEFVVQGDEVGYAIAIPLMILSTLILAAIADAATPLFQRILTRLWQDIDYLLARKSVVGPSSWVPSIGDTVRYIDQQWAVQSVEILLDDGNYYLCKIANEQQTRWVSQEQLQLMAPAVLTR